MTSVAATHDVPLPRRGGISPAYPAAKAALNRFVRALAQEIAEYNIPIIAVEPGFTLTERSQIILPQNNSDISRAHPMEIAVKTVRYLCICDHPMDYTGQVVIAAHFVKQHHLL